MSLRSRWVRLLTPARLHYAWIAGVVMWVAWLGSLLLGRGNLDARGTVVGADYLQFYTAGLTLRMGQSARLYDIPYQSALQQLVIGPRLSSYYAFITPPFLALLFVPFALLPYGASFTLWSLLGLAMLCVSLHWLNAPRQALLWALAFYPVLASASFGQNSLLSLALLTLTYVLWRKQQMLLAGLVCSLLMYKPQLTLGVGLLWLLSWRQDWHALLGWILGSSALASLCFAGWPLASRAYVEFALHVLPDLPEWKQFPLWHLHTIRGFWRLLLPGHNLLADVLTLLLDAVGLWAFWQLSRRLRGQDALRYAAAVALTLWLTPHAMIYDWAILLIPAVLLWQAAPNKKGLWTGLYALLWLTTLCSSTLSYAELQRWHAAVQISVPALVYTFWRAYQILRQPPAARG